ncbi:MAG: energy transducer TonB [Magnetospirillum sp.]|nr:energy transducer TonB [Magnetospirillum sp.]
MELHSLDRRQFAALALSALLHLVVTILLTMDNLSALLPEHTEKAMEVEVVSEPPPKPAPMPEPEPPPPPPPQAKPAPEPPTPVTTPQLQKAQLAEKSSAPRPTPRPEPARPTSDGSGLSADTGRFSKPAPAAGDLSQSAQDLVLSQVVRMWRFETASLRGSDVTLTATLIVNRDGTLSGPMNMSAPWNPDATIHGYSKLPDGITKRMLETFLLALRLAQPLQLPTDDGKPWPRRMILRFRPGDL